MPSAADASSASNSWRRVSVGFFGVLVVYLKHSKPNITIV
jgi:hypothetical protein